MRRVAYIEAGDIVKAKKIDLLTYLSNYEPKELVRVSSGTYCTREHDSLRISNGKWCWFSRGIGGRSALDYLVKVRGLPFTRAVETILGRTVEKPPVFCARKQKEARRLLMPRLSESTARVERYLSGRGIQPEIIRYCVARKLLFESADYHNAVFIGYDRAGNPRYGALRGIVGNYKGELSGSDKRCSFSVNENAKPEEVHVFESAIDLLSFASLELLEGRSWKAETYLSLAGVFRTRRENAIPVALSRYLEDYPTIATVRLHLDNDEAGRGAAKGIVSGLSGRYTVIDEPPLCGKDVNDQLKMRLGIQKGMRKEMEAQER